MGGQVGTDRPGAGPRRSRDAALEITSSGSSSALLSYRRSGPLPPEQHLLSSAATRRNPPPPPAARPASPTASSGEPSGARRCWRARFLSRQRGRQLVSHPGPLRSAPTRPLGLRSAYGEP